jgi:hypothetical protein
VRHGHQIIGIQRPRGFFKARQIPGHGPHELAGSITGCTGLVFGRQLALGFFHQLAQGGGNALGLLL